MRMPVALWSPCRDVSDEIDDTTIAIDETTILENFSCFVFSFQFSFQLLCRSLVLAIFCYSAQIHKQVKINDEIELRFAVSSWCHFQDHSDKSKLLARIAQILVENDSFCWHNPRLIAYSARNSVGRIFPSLSLGCTSV